MLRKSGRTGRPKSAPGYKSKEISEEAILTVAQDAYLISVGPSMRQKLACPRTHSTRSIAQSSIMNFPTGLNIYIN